MRHPKKSCVGHRPNVGHGRYWGRRKSVRCSYRTLPQVTRLRESARSRRLLIFPDAEQFDFSGAEGIRWKEVLGAVPDTTDGTRRKGKQMSFTHHFYAGAAEEHRKEVEALQKAAASVGRCGQWDMAVNYMRELEEQVAKLKAENARLRKEIPR